MTGGGPRLVYGDGWDDIKDCFTLGGRIGMVYTFLARKIKTILEKFRLSLIPTEGLFAKF